jgi:hypothetical protein
MRLIVLSCADQALTASTKKVSKINYILMNSLNFFYHLCSRYELPIK